MLCSNKDGLKNFADIKAVNTNVLEFNLSFFPHQRVFRPKLRVVYSDSDSSESYYSDDDYYDSDDDTYYYSSSEVRLCCYHNFKVWTHCYICTKY